MTSHRGRILLVQTNADFLRTLIIRLEREGFEVVGTTNPLSGFTLARQAGFDLYFLDLSLPGTGGAGLAEMIRGFAETTPILYISSEGVANQARMAAACQVEGCVHISDLDTLAQTVHALVDPAV